ncbi:MAG TPA: DUF1569 domain-containing protein [Panacibacter sp.]|nr:DUF1569 domain-containing protein [Panacibacter sp.]
MKSLFSAAESTAIIDRINKLSVTSKAGWGKMNVAQMLAHTQQPLKVAAGELKLKRGLAAILFGSIAKKKLAGDAPLPKNLPTDKNFIMKGELDFEAEKKGLVVLVERFAKLDQDMLSKEQHPFFGKLTAQEWDTLMWKHIDHHLRQFGV